MEGYYENGVCSSAGWKRVLLVSPYPTSSFRPESWFNSSTAIGRQQLHDYVLQHVTPGVAIPIALLGLVLPILLAFLVWRVLRCCRSHRSGHKPVVLDVLTSPWMMASKAFGSVCIAAAVALATTGMVMMPPRPTEQFQGALHNIFSYTDAMLAASDATLAQMDTVSSSTSAVNTILGASVPTTVLISDLQALGTNMDKLYDLGTLRTGLHTLDALVSRHLLPVIKDLEQDLDQCGQLLPAILQAANITDQLAMASAAQTAFVNALAAMPNSSFAPNATQALATLQLASSKLATSPLPSQLSTAAALVVVLKAVRDSQLFMQTSASLAAVSNSTAGVHVAAQAALSGLLAFNDTIEGLQRSSSSLLAQLRDIDTNIVALDDTTIGAMGLLTELKNTLAPSQSNSTTDTASLHQLAALLQAASSVVVPDAEGSAGAFIAAGASLLQMGNASSVADAQTWITAAGSAASSMQAIAQAVMLQLRQYESTPSDEKYTALVNATRAAMTQAATAATALAGPPPEAVLTLTTACRSTSTAISSAGLTDAALQVTAASQQLASYPGLLQDSLIALDLVGAAMQAFPTPPSTVLAHPQLLLTHAAQSAELALSTVTNQVQNVTAMVKPILQDARAQLQSAAGTRDRWMDRANALLDTVCSVSLGIYGGLIALLLALLAVVWLACPAGLVILSLTTLLYLLLIFTASGAAMGGMVVLQDACLASEALVLQQLQDSDVAVALGRYYLLGAGGSLTDVLQKVGVIDIRQVQDNISNSQAQLVASLQDQLQLRPKLSNAILNITTSITGVQAKLDDVLALADFAPIHALYRAAKSVPCCQAGAQLFTQWVCFTTSGVTALLAVLCCLKLLSRLDRLPRTRGCGFQCYLPGAFQGPLTPLRRAVHRPDYENPAAGMVTPGVKMGYPAAALPHHPRSQLQQQIHLDSAYTSSYATSSHADTSNGGYSAVLPDVESQVVLTGTQAAGPLVPYPPVPGMPLHQPGHLCPGKHNRPNRKTDDSATAMRPPKAMSKNAAALAFGQRQAEIVARHSPARQPVLDADTDRHVLACMAGQLPQPRPLAGSVIPRPGLAVEQMGAGDAERWQAAGALTVPEPGQPLGHVRLVVASSQATAAQASPTGQRQHEQQQQLTRGVAPTQPASPSAPALASAGEEAGWQIPGTTHSPAPDTHTGSAPALAHHLPGAGDRAGAAAAGTAAAVVVAASPSRTAPRTVQLVVLDEATAAQYERLMAHGK